MNRLNRVVAASSVLLLTTGAHAQVPGGQLGGDDPRERKNETSYEFDDDPLAATGSVAQGMRMQIRSHGKRTTLIRPRVHFIPELFESAEDL